jgi:RHS repeat-associated protein
MSRRARHTVLVLLAMVVLISHAMASSTGSINIAGGEQSTAGIWDIGTVTVSINNYAKTVSYGQFSTPDSIASAIAALFSTDCNGPANAKSYPGGVIAVQMRNSATLAQLNISFSSNLSFNGSTNLSTFETTTTATIGSTQLLLGQSTPVDVQVSCGSACGLVDYRLDGGEWGTVALDGNGHFQAGTGTNWSSGLHNVVVRFLGNGTYMPSTSDPVSFTISSSSTASPSTGIYNYNITSYQANGNVAAYTDSVNGSWNNIVYDGVNRLTAATQTPNGSSTQYLCWTYDSFGNRRTQTLSSTPCNVSSPPAPTSQWQYSANNQITSTNLAPQGLGYDASGDVTADGVNQYLYDAEGRVCAVMNTPISGGVGMTEYIYDAEGRRVAKGSISTWSCDTNVNGFIETNGYVLGPAGEQVTEVDGGGNWLHTNVYAAGQLIATYENDQQIHFHLDDWLGTRRVQTNYAGVVEQNCTSNPFGDAPPCVGATEHFFTGKERDTESGLDYFGARYYASSMGRWMSPDWAEKPEAVPYSSLDNPQTLNLYGYVNNNPITKRDPDGHVVGVDDAAEVTVGAVVFGGLVVSAYLSQPSTQRSLSDAASSAVTTISSWFHKSDANTPVIPYPGNDPTVPPGPGWEWRGNGPPSSGQGSWVNPQTGESLHPDLAHPEPIGPHWDHTKGKGDKGRRIKPDGTVEEKGKPKPQPQPKPKPEPPPQPQPKPTS